MGSGNDFDMWAFFTGCGDNLASLVTVRDSEQQPASAVQMRQIHNLFVSRVAQHRADAALAKLVDASAGGFNHYQGDPLGHQLLTEQAADAAKTDQQRVVADIYGDLFLLLNRFFQGLLFEGFGLLEIFLQQGKQYRV